eukprot:CAMPEP_0177695858 /NCGR_PEP_ID=MMETSP0484_2-20121128/3679_1 /TAXON_ID=354590 /ORGANISM="Rhodomonas lens, Strain RHODO" /LENGTH=395 /DNA_ID=CAMNT_0019206807 /DNA_START=106 /DNA_END=1289 /DNA_ORIENTATION=-
MFLMSRSGGMEGAQQAGGIIHMPGTPGMDILPQPQNSFIHFPGTPSMDGLVHAPSMMYMSQPNPMELPIGSHSGLMQVTAPGTPAMDPMPSASGGLGMHAQSSGQMEFVNNHNSGFVPFCPSTPADISALPVATEVRAVARAVAVERPQAAASKSAERAANEKRSTGKRTGRDDQSGADEDPLVVFRVKKRIAPSSTGEGGRSVRSAEDRWFAHMGSEQRGARSARGRGSASMGRGRAIAGCVEEHRSATMERSGGIARIVGVRRCVSMGCIVDDARSAEGRSFVRMTRGERGAETAGAHAVHKNAKNFCPRCGASEDCEHGKKRIECKECGEICLHGRHHTYCKECGGAAWCQHGQLKTKCEECIALQPCEHGNQKKVCNYCFLASLVDSKDGV